MGGQTLLRRSGETVGREREAGEGGHRERELTVWKGLYWSTGSTLELVAWVTEGS